MNHPLAMIINGLEIKPGVVGHESDSEIAKSTVVRAFSSAIHGLHRISGLAQQLGGVKTHKNKQQLGINMNEKGNMAVVLYVAVMIVVVVSVDLLFFKHRFWERLMVNIGIVLVFAAFYLRFLRSP
jgi:hypothetical protein